MDAREMLKKKLHAACMECLELHGNLEDPRLHNIMLECYRGGLQHFEVKSIIANARATHLNNRTVADALKRA